MSDDTQALVPVEGEKSAGELPKKSKVRKPALIETAYAVSLYTVVVAMVATVILSLAAGADVFMMLVRGGSVVLVLGGVAWFLSYLLRHSTLAAEVDGLQRKKDAPPAAGSEASATMGLEWKA